MMTAIHDRAQSTVRTNLKNGTNSIREGLPSEILPSHWHNLAVQAKPLARVASLRRLNLDHRRRSKFVHVETPPSSRTLGLEALSSSSTIRSKRVGGNLCLGYTTGISGFSGSFAAPGLRKPGNAVIPRFPSPVENPRVGGSIPSLGTHAGCSPQSGSPARETSCVVPVLRKAFVHERAIPSLGTHACDRSAALWSMTIVC